MLFGRYNVTVTACGGGHHRHLSNIIQPNWIALPQTLLFDLYYRVLLFTDFLYMIANGAQTQQWLFSLLTEKLVHDYVNVMHSVSLKFTIKSYSSCPIDTSTFFFCIQMQLQTTKQVLTLQSFKAPLVFRPLQKHFFFSFCHKNTSWIFDSICFA